MMVKSPQMVQSGTVLKLLFSAPLTPLLRSKVWPICHMSYETQLDPAHRLIPLSFCEQKKTDLNQLVFFTFLH